MHFVASSQPFELRIPLARAFFFFVRCCFSLALHSPECNTLIIIMQLISHIPFREARLKHVHIASQCAACCSCAHSRSPQCLSHTYICECMNATIVHCTRPLTRPNRPSVPPFFAQNYDEEIKMIACIRSIVSNEFSYKFRILIRVSFSSSTLLMRCKRCNTLFI